MKKGQITIFIVAGIAILLVIGLGYTAWKIINEQKPPADQNKKETNVELKPLSNLMNDCLDRTSRQVLSQAGLHAGYVNPQQLGYLAIPGKPTATAAFEPFPGQLVPYWSDMNTPDTCTDCVLGSEQPQLSGTFPSVESQVESAITALLPACLQDFDSVRNIYPNIQATGEPKVTVSFGESATLVSLTYPIQVQTEAQSITTLQDFSTNIDVPFKKLYDEAAEIRRVQDQQHFFEGLTIETVALQATGDKPAIPPPFGGTTMEFYDSSLWTLSATKDIVQRALEQDISNVALVGSKDMNFVYTSNASVNEAYANYLLSANNVDPTITASFIYLQDWGSYMRVRPGGQIIRPDSMNFGVPLLPSLYRKDFDYDVSYPVLVQLQTDTSKGTYLFQFGLETNMRANAPLPLEPIEQVPPSASFCDPSLANGGQVNISVVDSQGNLVDGRIHYSCLTSTCDYDYTRGGKMQLQLPLCTVGTLEAERDGFKGSQMRFDSAPGDSENVTLNLTKLTTVNITLDARPIVKKTNTTTVGGIPLSVSYWDRGDNTIPISTPRTALVVFEPRNDSEHSQVLQFPTNGSTTVDLYPTTYDISVVVLQQLDEPYKIPGKRVCAGGILGIGDKCTDIPDIWLGNATATDDQGNTYQTGGQVYVGGLSWNENTKNITITQDVLDRGQITIPAAVIYLTSIQSIDDMDVFDKIDPISQELNIG